MDGMEIHATNDFAASVPTVFAMLTDRVFLRAVCLATDPLEHEVWVDGLRTATRRVMPTPSVVSRLAGTVTLLPGGRGSVLTYAGELTVRIPVLGPGLAKQAAPLLLEALEIQQRVGDEFLAR
jgi:hypothetical protein